MKRQFLIGFLVVMAFGCTRKLHVEREPNVAIEKYQSYAWNKLEATKASHPFYHSIELNQLIVREIDVSLAKKGFRRNMINPDFLVDFHIYVEEQKFQNLVCGAGFYRGERFLPELGQNTYCESPEIVNYDDGTLIIDVVDASTGQLVWRASMSDIIDNPSFAGAIFSKKVKRILKRFPTQNKTRTQANQSDFEKVISIK
ncbi:hypothetical protein EMA8858_00179 [Emticicia aquatica]|uniref:DUF4136 domain-containing protein n=1 Tax=Emticicia aquatica TaxID=1681835 RepID=A0ABM9AK26_9BACT|nr:DUF4136 domain-containing protein [Emticicia aquatica]CAH0994072.1 hypothetical protein EMA8858_00179 [Emticicia aquatica]